MYIRIFEVKNCKMTWLFSSLIQYIHICLLLHLLLTSIWQEKSKPWHKCPWNIYTTRKKKLDNYHSYVNTSNSFRRLKESLLGSIDFHFSLTCRSSFQFLFCVCVCWNQTDLIVYASTTNQQLTIYQRRNNFTLVVASQLLGLHTTVGYY
jgi:hypothetical protein